MGVFGSGQAGGSRWESGGRSRMSTSHLDNDQRSLAQDEVIISDSRYVSRLPDGTARRIEPSARPGPAPVMQSASVAPSGLNRLQTVNDQAPNSGLGPGIPTARDTNPLQVPERALPTTEPGNNANARPNGKANGAAIKIASVNMRGYGGQNALSPQNKWQHVNQADRKSVV